LVTKCVATSRQEVHTFSFTNIEIDDVLKKRNGWVYEIMAEMAATGMPLLNQDIYPYPSKEVMPLPTTNKVLLPKASQDPEGIRQGIGPLSLQSVLQSSYL
jgi:hypothetical protein